MEQMISFLSEKNTLRGILHVPGDDVAGYPVIVLCHGFTGNKIGLHRILVKAARVFCEKGYAVLRFDFSGCGDSDGEHQNISIDGQVREVRAACRFLRENPQFRKAPFFLLGLSMGGAIAALATEYTDDLSGLVLWAPVADMYNDIRGIVGDRIFAEATAAGVADFNGFLLGKQFVESLRCNYPVSAAAGFKDPVLVVHGTEDPEIPYQNAGLYKEARSSRDLPTEIHLIPDADHTFSSVAWENKVIDITATWLEQNTR